MLMIDILYGVKMTDIGDVNRKWANDLHLAIEVVVNNETQGHAN